MWTAKQYQRLVLENEVLQKEGFTQFSVYRDTVADSYYASGWTLSNAGYRYRLYIPIPSGFPYQRPPMYITDPLPLLMWDGTPISRLGVSHQMHTLAPSSNGWVQICHWRDARWHSGILLQKVFLKGLIWIEAYEQHMATGRPLAEFVRTMAETL
ncbi:MAG TPA: hypothetical protein VG028_05585 [Terriglobia bacterium]|nr:hypothetical protein [Terriglobia bacterium]